MKVEVTDVCLRYPGERSFNLILCKLNNRDKPGASNMQLDAEHGLIRQRDEMDAFPIDYLFFFLSITDIRLSSMLATVEVNTSKAFNIPIVIEFALVRSVSHNRGRKEVMASATLCFAAQSGRAP